MKLELVEERRPELFDALVAGVREYNDGILGTEVSRPLYALVRDDSGELIGGVAGRTIYDHFLIEVVWVAKAWRGRGLGRELMQAAERRAIERGCVGAQVDTLSFQGPRFYARLGFEVIGKVEGFPRGHDRYFLHKSYRNVSAAGRD